VLAGVHRALRPGGRFVGEFGGAGNVALIEAALGEALARRGVDAAAINPWYFPSPEEYGEKLRAHGFDVRSIELIPRPTPLPGSLVDWLHTFAEPFASSLPADQRDAFFEDVQQALRPTLCGRDGRWTVDYVRLRFAALRKEAASNQRPYR
jgi:hypothetical protein